MFVKFDARFVRDPGPSVNGPGKSDLAEPPKLHEFFAKYGGASFENGLYRVIRPSDMSLWKSRLQVAFPEITTIINCFAYDWLGRAFALDAARLEDGEPGVVLLDPGAGEWYEIPSNLTTFHNGGLIEYGDAALSISFYGRWLLSGGQPATYDHCIGYRLPLFMGGADEIENLEYADVDVYWELMGQLIEQTRNLPPGSRIHMR